MGDKKLSSEKGDYTDRFKPSTKKYIAGQNTILAIGQYDDKNGIFIEWLSTGKIVVRIDGKDYKQTIEEFVNNCK